MIKTRSSDQKKIKVLCKECNFTYSVEYTKKDIFTKCLGCYKTEVSKNIDNLCNPVNNSDEAYLIGLVYQCGTQQENSYLVKVKRDDTFVLNKINKLLFGGTLRINYNETYSSINVQGTLYKTLKNINSHIVEYVKNLPENYIKHFTRGLFDCTSYINDKPIGKFSTKSKELLEYVLEKCNVVADVVADIQCNKNDNLHTFSFVLSDEALLDFVDLLYKDTKNNIYSKKMFDHYKKLCTWYVYSDQYNSFKWLKNDPDAVAPFKERASDSGYDLTLIKLLKTSGSVEFYDTGISVEPPYGYYFDLVGRSSISKSGYILANNMGVIDRSYRGSIIVPLVKIDFTKPNIQLPCRLVQIIPRTICHLQPIESNSLVKTSRGSGGFGSSNKQN